MPIAKPTPKTDETSWRLDILQWQIQSQNLGFRRCFYGSLLQLYAAIGRICQKHLELNPATKPVTVLQEMSDRLSAKYGQLFRLTELKQIILFAQQYQPYPSTRGRDIFYFNWDYLAVLLPFTNQEEQHFYMRAAATKRWSVAELQKHIAADDYKNPKVSKALKAKVRKPTHSSANCKNLLEMQRSAWRHYKDFRNMPFLNPFIEPAVSDYKLLLNPSADEPQLTYAQFNEGIKADNFDSIPLHVVRFREQINQDFNSTFNHLLWNLGKLLTLPAATEDKLSGKLRQLYGGFFNADFIAAMKVYHNSVTNRDVEQRLTSVITWSHILLLLPLPSSQAQLFYAELAHEEDLTPTELQRRIESKWYEQALADLNRQHPPSETAAIEQNQHEKKAKKNKTLVVDYTAVDVNDIRQFHHNLNILQNHYFMQFMAVQLP